MYGVACEPVTDLSRLGIADDDLVDDFVVTTGARRVMGAVQDQVAPCNCRERVRVLRGGQQQRRQRLRALLQRPFGGRARAVHVDAVRSHTHEEVRARTRTELSVHRGERCCRLQCEVLGQ